MRSTERATELLALRDAAIHRDDADAVAIIEAELWVAGIPLAANDNEPPASS